MSGYTARMEVAMARRVWVQNPHSGGSKISDAVQERTRDRILVHAKRTYDGRYSRIDVRFRAQFCYIDAFKEPELSDSWPPPDWPESRDAYLERMRATPFHLCRLRYFSGLDRWSLAFYAYSSESYEPSFFQSGEWFGTPEEGLDVGAVYL